MQWTKASVLAAILPLQQQIDRELKAYFKQFTTADREDISKQRIALAQKTTTFRQQYKDQRDDEIISTDEVTALLNAYNEFLVFLSAKIPAPQSVESHESKTVVEQAANLSILLRRLKEFIE